MTQQEQEQEQASQMLFNKVATYVKLVGSESTNTQVVGLLAYIRNIINSGGTGTIKVTVGKNVANDVFNFDVNDQEVPDLRAQSEMEIN